MLLQQIREILFEVTFQTVKDEILQNFKPSLLKTRAQFQTVKDEILLVYLRDFKYSGTISNR